MFYNEIFCIFIHVSKDFVVFLKYTCLELLGLLISSLSLSMLLRVSEWDGAGMGAAQWVIWVPEIRIASQSLRAQGCVGSFMSQHFV